MPGLGKTLRKQMIQTNYRRDIDGLRAVAVLLTVFFHADYQYFSGGFIGVNVFFVISGYVVSMMLLRSMESGKFSLIEFYTRRAKRLAPALYTMLIAALSIGYLYLPADMMMEIALSTKYVAIFWANVFFAGRSTYFDNWAEMKPLLHTWSLSVEEQFYLLLPLGLYWALGKKRNLKRAAIIILMVGFFSFVYSEYSVQFVQNHFGVSNKLTRSSFFFITSRAFEFIIGVLLAMAVYSNTAFVKRLATVLGKVSIPLGLFGLFLSAALMTKQTPFPGAMALIPDILTGLILFSGTVPQTGAWLLENRVSVFFGRISYCLYLWHWLVFFCIRYIVGELTLEGSLLGIAISILLATLTHYFIENKLRYLVIPNTQGIILFVVVPILFAVGISKLSGKTNGFDFRLSDVEKQLEKTQLDSLYILPIATECHTTKVLPPEKCRVGDSNRPVNAVLWGDSHAYHMLSFVDQLAQQYQWNVRTLTHNGCAPIQGPDLKLPAGQELCVRHNKDALDYILNNPQIQYVIIGTVGAGTSQGKQFYEVLDRLKAAGKEVLILDDVPNISHGLVNCELKNLRLPKVLQTSDCTYSVESYLVARQGIEKGLEEIKKLYSNVKVITVHDALCDDQKCYTSVNSLPVYMKLDASHLNRFGSDIYYDLYRKKHPTELETLLGAIKHNRELNTELKLGR